MIVKTISGSRYEIDYSGICRKFDKENNHVDSFKVYVMKAIPTSISDIGEVWDVANGLPEVGKLMYVGGIDGWWLSTEVIEIVEQEVSPPSRFRDVSNGE